MKSRITALVAFTIIIIRLPVSAQLIDFEKLPTGSLPTEGMAISNQFLTQFGVSFAYTNGSFPIIAEVGSPGIAFVYGPNNLADQPAPNQNVGRFFLTDNFSGRPPPLVISYLSPVQFASGVILDIDHQDAWTIEARTCATQIVATAYLTNGSPNTGDGLATPWSFSRPSADICSILIRFSGTSPTPGLAFDNFSPSLPITPPTAGIQISSTGATVSVAGSFGSAYDIQFSASPASSNWQTLTRLVLTNAPEQTFIDYTASNAPVRFYRAVGVQ